MANNGMETEGIGTDKLLPFKEDRRALTKLYTALKETAKSIAPLVDFTIDYNCHIVLSYVVQYLANNKESNTVGTYRTYSMAKHPTNPNELVLESKEWTPVQATVEATVDKVFNERMPKSFWFPFLAAFQNAMKTPDVLLYQRNTVSSSLGAPASCEIFACGKQIKDTLKKSRPKMVEPSWNQIICKTTNIKIHLEKH
ncbi:hypothetical protein JTE90_025367 [Oedothorax gibbosus]|uniref:Uncharacterized protein n=1 Tax=Oedothorax gibbosus TaxID=931172 RepID=A0AAV6TSG4_9ARAC|nr:hypothetical protein JTE90_025367 [Oedothorax gibbosus]